ncbi:MULTISPECIES: hypothetical protein [Achromobacter]|uniref:Uncharacterized protein n=1 Tax=Achromobacter xylosoxidans (strain A8) TaxID=762376 RepID=E3HYJ7_ACHXA|nr:hypothetical protein [Achromobacter xylosoxidans]ADP20151.1 hypothetical protein AXYL_06869 [Achromobacter xylosoxidans A8]
MDNRFICGGRLLRRLASEAGLTFTIQEDGQDRRSIVACDDALESNVLGPLVALQAERVWQALFPEFRGFATGASFTVQPESLVGLAVHWPLLGRDLASLHRMLAIARAADSLLDWERRQVIEVEEMVDWYQSLQVQLLDDVLYLPATPEWPATRVPLIFIESEQQVPKEHAHA